METTNPIPRKQFTAFAREWDPYVLTALIVPGGIVISLALLARRWKQRRVAVGFQGVAHSART